MNAKNVFLALIIPLLLVTSCRLPQEASQSSPAPAVSPSMQLSVTTDTSRSQGIYVNETGTKIDIVSQEGGTSVRCVEADAIVAVDQASQSPALSNIRTSQQDQLKAVVLGRRDDGSPGVWEVTRDDRIHPAAENEGGDNSSKLCEAREIGWLLHSAFGWHYHALQILGPDSGKGFIIVGVAENKKGFDHGPFNIDPGTTVAVYWRLTPSRYGHLKVSRARVIGQPSAQYATLLAQTDNDFSNWQRFPFHNSFFFRGRVPSFALFFLDWFDIYLTGVTASSYDKSADDYLATGPLTGSAVPAGTQTGTATIQLDGTISIALASGGGGGQAYPRIVIETYPYKSGAAATFINLALYDSKGAQVALSSTVPVSDPNYPSGRIDYTGGLSPGTYYVKITDNGTSGGPYVIRAVSLALTDALPAYVYPGGIATEPWPDGDDASTGNIPAAPKVISLGASNYLNRLLDMSADQSFTPGDVDWVKITLP